MDCLPPHPLGFNFFLLLFQLAHRAFSSASPSVPSFPDGATASSLARDASAAVVASVGCEDCLRRLRRRWRQCVRPPASCSSCSVSRGSPEHRHPRTTVRRWLGAPFFQYCLLRYSSASLLLCYYLQLRHICCLLVLQECRLEWKCGIVSVGSRL